MAIQMTQHAGAGQADAAQGAGLLQTNSLAGSAPSESVLYSPIARRPYTRDPNGRTAAADLPAGLATPQTPRSVSRLAGISPGAGPWPGARSPSVPIMTMLQVRHHATQHRFTPYARCTDDEIDARTLDLQKAGLPLLLCVAMSTVGQLLLQISCFQHSNASMLSMTLA